MKTSKKVIQELDKLRSRTVIRLRKPGNTKFDLYNGWAPRQKVGGFLQSEISVAVLLPAPTLAALPLCSFAIFVHNIACLTGVIREGERGKWGTLSVIFYFNFSCSPSPSPSPSKLQQPHSQGLSSSRPQELLGMGRGELVYKGIMDACMAFSHEVYTVEITAAMQAMQWHNSLPI